MVYHRHKHWSSKLRKRNVSRKTTLSHVALTSLHHCVTTCGNMLCILTDIDLQFARKFFVCRCTLVSSKLLNTTAYIIRRTAGKLDDKVKHWSHKSYVKRHFTHCDDYDQPLTHRCNCQLHEMTDTNHFILVFQLELRDRENLLTFLVTYENYSGSLKPGQIETKELNS